MCIHRVLSVRCGKAKNKNEAFLREVQNMIKAGFVVPVYRHGGTVGEVVRSLLPLGLPIILVDDGNDEAGRVLINEAAELSSLVTVVTRKKNGGKGAAVKDGVMKAKEMSLTHVFQVDSDGQHDISSVPLFLQESNKHPNCIICGYPQYDDTVPEGRKTGREVSNKYARFLSVSGELKDVLCGFRVYPVDPFVYLINHTILDSRMGFDIEVLVRLAWKGIDVFNYPVNVTYPIDGVSNFHIVRDNIRIALTFTRLSFGLVWRFPYLFYRKCKKNCKRHKHLPRISAPMSAKWAVAEKIGSGGQ